MESLQLLHSESILQVTLETINLEPFSAITTHTQGRTYTHTYIDKYTTQIPPLATDWCMDFILCAEAKNKLDSKYKPRFQISWNVFSATKL